MFTKLKEWLAAIAAFVKTAGAPNEEDTERDGFLSYSAETHGLALGFYHGFIDFKDWGGLPEGYAEGKHVEAGHYPKAGYVIGAVVRVACYVAIGGWAFTML